MEYVIALVVVWFFVWFFFIRNKYNVTKKKLSMDEFYESVIKYKIVKKYDEDPKWATYLYFKDGKEGWSRTIPGSFMAKDPKNDLTFVQYSKEEAERYAAVTFEKAQYIEE